MDRQQSQPCKGAAYPTKYRRNQPRSKNGCLTCRSKRKKCDETRPRCTSCVRSNQTCVWSSKDEQESPPSNSVGNTSDSTSSTSERKRSPNEDPQTAISDLNLAMESLIFQRFFFDWATSGNTSGGYTMSWFANLFQTYTNASIDSLVHKSINALANASYGQRFNSPEALTKGNKWYGRAIQMLKVKLLSINDSSSYCDVVSAITLLGIYEIYGSFLNGQAPPIPWTSVNKLALPKSPAFYAHIELIYEAACQFAEWRTALLDYESDEGLERLSNVAKKASMLDRRFEEWAESAPESLRYETDPLPLEPHPEWVQPLINSPWRPLSYHTYSTLMVQIIWRFYWMARVIINQALLFTYDILREQKGNVDPSIPAEPTLKTRFYHSPICYGDPQMEAEKVPTLLGYLILQVLPALGLFYEQIVFTGVDTFGRREWVAKMRHFLRVNFGIAKGITAIPPSHVGKIPIQTWGLPDEFPRGSK
ncbi:hypothetical protein FCULG_00011155 [Fusarium culmorum]|uniref:Zn(2)-C6 fungal-type domain-containing protein n=1 Tax=Fusarium culmorum TaxID=5516 RepID=A0A2T4GZI6_FUSCU|nr:hypothetical protein FCULG_00011155 [Fusarium culmorum]